MNLKKPTLAILASSLLLVSFLFYDASAESVPEWVRNTALWYGEGNISETEFLNALKFLLENQIIVVDIEVVEEKVLKASTATVIMPNGNSDMGNVGFYIPLNLEVTKGTTVIWLNDDVIGHTIQSQDGEGNVIGLFNSDVLETGERFAFKMEEEGVFNYFCTLHPWRVGVITVR
jgi:plastocyanin